ncbi:hypothetical protein AB205_0045640 [Aquarana catesbeiana]|uniref:C2H2-type domain-containing protein n=1 Tax=Aquarana catesbeiana TaxID=8400 RepID=A0A2G9R4X6_AQUCT|nr:hypothetical protein AB205_0045640 [Aquarana catesbeiana]
MRVNTGESPFSCSECWNLSLRNILAEHLRGKSFSQKHILAKHQIVNTWESPFSCSECRKSFSQKHILDEHLRFNTGEIFVYVFGVWESYHSKMCIC